MMVYIVTRESEDGHSKVALVFKTQDQAESYCNARNKRNMTYCYDWEEHIVEEPES